MAASKEMRNAKAAKKDEFYTTLEDIEKEMNYYKQHFKGKIVFCNCDDPFESNFFKFFAMNFNSLGLKKLISTCYATSPVAGNELDYYENSNGQLSFLPRSNAVPVGEKRRPYRVEITEVTDENGDGRIDLADVEYLLRNKKNILTLLEGDGDFRSDECVELLKQADIVVTNPPFSLLAEYVSLLVKHEKKFIIIGSIASVLIREIFPLFKDNKVWLGASIHSGDRKFYVPDDYPLEAATCGVDENGKRFIRVKGVRWYTNLEYPQRHEDLILYKKYIPEEYPTYDNFDGINVVKTAEIPFDYYGYIGVSVSFFDFYNPSQFEICGLGSGDAAKQLCVSKNHRGRTDLAYTTPDGKHKSPFTRVIIRRKRSNEN